MATPNPPVWFWLLMLAEWVLLALGLWWFYKRVEATDVPEQKRD